MCKENEGDKKKKKKIKLKDNYAIRNYYRGYRKRHSDKSIDDAKRATLNYIVGMHEVLFGEKPSPEVYEEYKKFVNSLE